MTTKEMLEYEVKIYNENVGDMKELDCPICKNKGYIAREFHGMVDLVPCECLNVRNAKVLLRKSGMQSLIERFTFDNFTKEEHWQQYIYDKAKSYLNEKDKWLYIGGQIGSGKTHICSAIVGNLINKGIETIYMLWRDTIVTLKSNKEEYSDLIYDLKHAKVLYIDDFLKSQTPTDADLNIAFEILNYRYLNNLRTIISSELTIKELTSLSESIGSRIVEKSKEYLVSVARDGSKNIRIKGE